MAKYGQEFKDRAVARLLPPESASVDVVSREIGVSVAPLERWRSDALSMPGRVKVVAAINASRSPRLSGTCSRAATLSHGGIDKQGTRGELRQYWRNV